MEKHTTKEPIKLIDDRHLDALVAEHILGYNWWQLLPVGFRGEDAAGAWILLQEPYSKAEEYKTKFPFIEPAQTSGSLSNDWDIKVPPVSSSPTAAWTKLQPAMEAKGYALTLVQILTRAKDGRLALVWQAMYNKPGTTGRLAEAQTPEEAMCRSALMQLGFEFEE